MFYTQHDINDYIGLEADGKYHFYATKMAVDIFGGTVFKCSSTEISFDVDSSEKGPEIYFTFGTFDDTNTLGDGDWRGFRLTYYGYSCFVKCQKSPDERLYYIENLVYRINYDIAALSLYICENVERWYKENNHGFWYDIASHLSINRFYTWDTYGQPK